MSDSDDDDEAPLLVNLEEQDDVVAREASTDVVNFNNNNEETNLTHQPDIASSDLPPCPVTILSGFLGSGKTTLIQYILKSPDHKHRIAVIENEFGEGLEVESMIAKDGVDNSSLADFIELPNGCVCCTVKDNLVVTLETLLEKRNDLDYILIEASGMANPGPIASVFWLDDALESRIRLDGIVTLVDSYHIHKQLKETLEASQQIAYADRILLNKTDLLVSAATTTTTTTTDNTATTVGSIEKLIRTINPAAQIRSTTYSQIPDLEWILDAKCYEDHQGGVGKIGDAIEQVVVATTSSHSHSHHSHDHDHDHDHQNCEECNHHHGHGHDHDHHDHQSHHPTTKNQPNKKDEEQHSHTGDISTMAFVENGTMDYEKLNSFLASTLWPNQDEKDEVLRSRLEEQMQLGGAMTTNNNNDESSSTTKDDDEQQKRQQQQQQQAHGDDPSGGTLSSSSQEQQIFRIKGVISVRRDQERIDFNQEEWAKYCGPHGGIDQRRYIVQAVYDLWEIHPSNSESFLEGEDRQCKLVIIGRHLQQEELIRGLRACLI